jgi:uncharacterized membrane protein
MAMGVMTPVSRWPLGTRAAICGACGVIVGCGVMLATSPRVAILLGWDAAAVLLLLQVWLTVGPLDAAATKAHARIEDATRPSSEMIVLASGLALLAAVGLLLIQAGESHGSSKALLIVVGVTSAVLAWATLHTIFMLRYARCHYGEPKGAVSFNEDEPPDYRDFAYLAFTVGMTFQVSDTDLTAKSMRRTVLSHALFSYLYGAVILALSINVVASLLG